MSAVPRSSRRCCLRCQALRFKTGDEVVDLDGERCRVVDVDPADADKPYELEYPNGSRYWAAESAIRPHKVRRCCLAISARSLGAPARCARAGRACGRAGCEVQGGGGGESPEGPLLFGCGRPPHAASRCPCYTLRAGAGTQRLGADEGVRDGLVGRRRQAARVPGRAFASQPGRALARRALSTAAAGRGARRRSRVAFRGGAHRPVRGAEQVAVSGLCVRRWHR